MALNAREQRQSEGIGILIGSATESIDVPILHAFERNVYVDGFEIGRRLPDGERERELGQWYCVYIIDRSVIKVLPNLTGRYRVTITHANAIHVEDSQYKHDSCLCHLYTAHCHPFPSPLFLFVPLDLPFLEISNWLVHVSETNSQSRIATIPYYNPSVYYYCSNAFFIPNLILCSYREKVLLFDPNPFYADTLNDLVLLIFNIYIYTFHSRQKMESQNTW